MLLSLFPHGCIRLHRVLVQPFSSCVVLGRSSYFLCSVVYEGKNISVAWFASSRCQQTHSCFTSMSESLSKKWHGTWSYAWASREGCGQGHGRLWRLRGWEPSFGDPHSFQMRPSGTPASVRVSVTAQQPLVSCTSCEYPHSLSTATVFSNIFLAPVSPFQIF